MAAGITAIVLTKNEEANITRCLDSLKWCDEIIVIDDNSLDNTIPLAEKAGVKVKHHVLDDDFSQQRNFGLSLAKNDWVLFVDADEEISLSLQYEITNHINDQFHHIDGFLLKRVDEMWGRKLVHGEVGDNYILRLAKKTSGEWQGRVHEVWKIKGKTQKLQNPLFHYPHPTVKDFLTEINFYSTLRAKELLQNNKRIPAWNIVVYPIVKLFTSYIVHLGFLDGMPGLVVAVMMSFHSFLVRGKAWLAYEKNI